MKSEPFSIPFKITNAGLLPIKRMRIVVYAQEIKLPGENVISSGVVTSQDWNTEQLNRGQSRTIICRLVVGAIPTSADLNIVVDYEATGVPFYRIRDIFRFEGIYGDAWQWLGQPSNNALRDEIERRIPKD